MATPLQTKRCREKLSYEGHLYVFAQMSKDDSTEFWRCQYKNSATRKCTARIHKLVDSGEITVYGIHSDLPDAAAAEVNEKKTALKRRAVETEEAPQQILAKVRCNTSLAAQGKLESNRSLARMIQRNRNRHGTPSSHYTRVEDIDIPEEYRYYESTPGQRELFLLGDSQASVDEPDHKRILIFGRVSQRTSISEVEKIYVDGTFSLTPKLFAQLYVILGERPGSVTPLCYVLMADKSETSYCKVSVSKRKYPQRSPLNSRPSFQKAPLLRPLHSMSPFRC